VLIGYSGSMGACQAHEAWNYSNMNMETITGWYRSDIRRRPAFGVQNLLQCGYIVRQGIHADGLETAEQSFDVKTGVLTTRCNLEFAEVQVATFLSRDHLLVHRFVVDARREEMALQFFVRSASVSALRVNVAPANERAGDPAATTMDFTVEGKGWPSTPGRVFCDHPKPKGHLLQWQPGSRYHLPADASLP